MKSEFNEFTMNKAALFSNGLEIIEHFGRFYVVKKKKGGNEYKLFANCGSFQNALNLAYLI